MPKMKNVAKNEIVLLDPYSNALCPPQIEPKHAQDLS